MWKYIGGGAASEKRRPSTGASLFEYIRKIKVCGPRLFEDAVENIPSKSKQEGDGIVTSGPSSASVHDPLLRGSSTDAESGFDASASETDAASVAVTTPPTATPAATASSPVTTSALATVPRHDNDSLHQQQPSTTISTIDDSKPGVILGEFPPVNYDAMYEDEVEEGINMEGHGYIIQHLISQVKIGMDLTKVVLPTFILERRSLLEMYADFFAHPDLFVSIADHDDPRDRMVQVLKWYLSAFHAGRKSEVAKKPYNPIIGEVFKCYWDVPGREKGQTIVKDGPVPWATTNQLSFIAEQVSHHPPISAFYAEHKAKNISFCGHIWTKSKFLGLSVCVQNIGQGCVCLIDRNEEYIVHFPSGYGRSILTVPWVELGGSCQISCSKTGYNAQIEFCTKPFYGGKKHRVTAEVFSPGEKKAFLNVDGEWNGAITAKWNDGRTENFIDTTTTPIIKKNAKPVVEQEDNESRRLWLDVTYGLRFNQIARATAGKCMLEQKQRDEAKERKEIDQAWEQKLFTAAGDNWVYNYPLQKRIDPQAGV